MFNALLAAIVSIAILPEWATVTIRIQEMDHARDRWLDGQTTIISCQRHCAVRCAVIGAIPRQDFVTSRIEAGDFDRVLIRFRAAQGEEGFL